MWEALSLLVLTSPAAAETVVQVNLGFFKEPAGHLWAYGVDAHSWTDVEENVTFRFTFWPQTSGGKIVKKLQTGELDVAHVGNAPWGTGATRGIPAKMVYLIHSKDLSQVLVARRGLDGPQDFVGTRVARIAYIKGTTTHYMLQAFFAHSSVSVEDLDWVGHMSAKDQRDAWDKGEIDAGFMWGANMRYLQENEWCSRPDPSSPKYRPCADAGKGKLGHNIFTAGMSRTWGAETWNNLVVRDAFLEAYPRAAARIVKVAATMDTKFVQDPGFLKNYDDRLCQVAVAAGELCDAAGLATVERALGYDNWLEYAVQRSPAYLAERLPGACAAGKCTRDTMSGSAWATWAISEFSYRLKFMPYLPPHKFYQEMMAPQFVGLVHTAADVFPEITAEALVAQHTTQLVLESDPAYGFCGDLEQPIVLTQPGVFTDHEGGGFHQDGVHCEWHITGSERVLLSDIEVRIETDGDNVYVYEGLCSFTGGTCAEATLLARFTGGKGMSEFTMENLNPRPPILVPGGLATVVFAVDDTVDRPLGPIVNDGLSMRWATAPSPGCALPCRNGGACVAGRCHCVGGWAGADCSSASCVGTVSLAASADTPGTLLNGVPGTPSGHNVDCRWVLTTEQPGHVIAVEINRLDLDWTHDPVTFHNGNGIEAAPLAKYSGYAPAKLDEAVGARCPGHGCPGAVISSGSVLTVRWTSDAMQSGDGFEFVYRSVDTSSAVCGVGAVAACSGHGTCVASGCICQDGWYGQFCQFSQCEGRADVLLGRGRISNMGPDEFSYAPLRDCFWVVRPPADEMGRSTGAIAFWFEVFDLEAIASPPGTFPSTAGDWVTVGGQIFDPSMPPCLANTSCWTDALSEAAGCNCTAVVVRGAEATVRFKTDMNNYPREDHFRGAVLRFEAVYDCPREDDGLCVALDECERLDMVAGRTACIHCKEGSVLRRGDSVGTYCHLCVPGRYQGFDSQGMPECQTCPAGRYAASEGQVLCEECRPGHSCSRGADHMEPCSAGTFTPANGSDSCQRCEVGTYQEDSGTTACVACKSQTTTLVLAATREEECVCARGFAMGAPGGSPCGRCPPVGVDCPGGGGPFTAEVRLDDTPRLLRGYMVMEGQPWEVYFCDSNKVGKWGDSYCPEGRSLYNASLMCGPGVASKPQCSRCLEGYMSTDAECKPCPANNGWLIVGKVLGGGSLFMIFLVYLYHKSNNRHSTGLLAVMSLINLLQTIHVMSRMDLQWQPPLNTMLAGLSEVFSIPGMVHAMLKVEVNCALNASFIPTFLTHVMVPLVVPFTYACIGVIAECVGRPLKRDKVINVVGKVFTGLMVSVSALAFSLFAATSMPNGKHMLKDYPEVELLSREWWRAMPIGLLAVLLYCVLLLAGIIHVVIHAPKAVSNNPHFTVRYLFIFGATRPDCWWWIIPVSLFAICLNAVQVLLSAVRNQLFLSALVVALFSALQTYVRPLKFRANNVVEDCLKLAYMLILVLASAFVDESRVAPEQRRELWHSSTILIIAIICCAALSSLAVLVRYIWWRFCRPPGTQVARTLQTAMEFRHTALLVGALHNEDYIKKAALLKDYDVHHLEQARRVLVSCFFMEQPGLHLWQQRLMPGHEFVCFHKGTAFRRLQAASEDGSLDAAVKDNLSDLLMLERLQQELALGTQSMPLSSLGSMAKFAPSARSTWCCDARRQLFGTADCPEQRKPMSQEALTKVVCALGPDLTKEQADKLSELLVVDASGVVTPEEASATLQGLVSTLGPEACRRSLNVLLQVTRRVEKSKCTLESEFPSGTEQAQPPNG